MATHAELAAKLLREAARFFRALAAGNHDMRIEMEANADACEVMADRVEVDPDGLVPPVAANDA